MASQRQPTAIWRQIGPKFQSKNHEIVAGLREAAGAGPPVDPHVKVQRLAAELSSQMALIHGGDWRVVVNHETAFVLISPQLSLE